LCAYLVWGKLGGDETIASVVANRALVKSLRSEPKYDPLPGEGLTDGNIS